MTVRASLVVDALSNADALGYRGQHALSQAMTGRGDYRIIGGHMVRLLLHLYPASRAVPRSTIDADAALKDVDVIGPVIQDLLEDDFIKTGGNVLRKDIGDDQRIEINILLEGRRGPGKMSAQSVAGVGQVDTLHELSFVMNSPAVVLDVTARIDDEVLCYQTRIPDLEAATVLKAHSWHGRRSPKDLADLSTLLEIREAHPGTSWRLHEQGLQGLRLDTARILSPLRERLTSRRTQLPVPRDVEPRRFAALIQKHVWKPETPGGLAR